MNISKKETIRFGSSALLFGMFLLAWLFCFFLETGCLIHAGYVTEYEGAHRLSSFAKFLWYTFPWSLLHLVAIGILLVLVFSQKAVAFALSISRCLSVFLLLALMLFVFLWWSGFRYIRPVLFPTPYQDIIAVTVSSLSIALICCFWYSLSQNKVALGLFLTLPLIHLLVVIFLWSSDRLESQFGAICLPSCYPTPLLFAFFILVVVVMAFLLRSTAQRFGIPPSSESALWLAGIGGLAISHFGFWGIMWVFYVGLIWEIPVDPVSVILLNLGFAVVELVLICMIVKGKASYKATLVVEHPR